MAAIAHGWKPAQSSGISIPVNVAQEFNQADSGRKKFRHSSGQFHHDPIEKGWTKP